jgi:transposase
MSYRQYLPPAPLLIGYDPFTDVPADHLARLVERAVEVAIEPPVRECAPGQPPFDPRLVLKVLVYGYCIGIRSSRQLERMCQESLPFLFLTRGDTPSYRTLCQTRTHSEAELEKVWITLIVSAGEAGLTCLGRVKIDSSKFRANAGSELVVSASDYEWLRAELNDILAEAAKADAIEDAEGTRVRVRMDRDVPPDHMRDILRRLRVQRNQAAADADPASDTDAPTPICLSQHMVSRIEASIVAIDMAEAEGLKHVSLTDPDARMMGEGCEKRVRECHSYEVVIDKGLIVASTTTNDVDSHRLATLVDAAAANEPDGVLAVDADSGYYSGDSVATLIDAGIDTSIPDTNVACDVHRNQPVGTLRASQAGGVPFTYDDDRDAYTCPQGNTLALVQQRRKCGQDTKIYRAVNECRDCPLAAICLTQKNAGRRSLSVGVRNDVLEPARKRFSEPAHVERYHHRSEVETVFAFIRSALGYKSWLLRGSQKVACEGKLFSLAYQLRKLHTAGFNM